MAQFGTFSDFTNSHITLTLQTALIPPLILRALVAWKMLTTIQRPMEVELRRRIAITSEVMLPLAHVEWALQNSK
jgi:hypothetical protein